jgi:hypothetical protein
MHIKNQQVFIFGLLLLFILAGCSASPTVSLAPTLPATTVVVVEPGATQTPVPSPTTTETALPPTETQIPTAQPTDTPVPTELPPTDTETPAPSATSQPLAFKDAIWVYYIELDTGGSDGCGDTAVPVSIGLPRTGNVAQDVETALRNLLSYKRPDFGPLYNPIYLSNITLNSVTFNESTGYLSVIMTGTYVHTKDSCDNTRVKNQMLRTVMQFPQIKGKNLEFNGGSFGDYVANSR